MIRAEDPERLKHKFVKFDLAAYRKRQGALLVVVSGLLGLGGIVLRDRISWYTTAFFAVCLLVGVLSMLGYSGDWLAPWDRLTIDEVGITRTYRKMREHVAWGDIARVRIWTTDKGPR